MGCGCFALGSVWVGWRCCLESCGERNLAALFVLQAVIAGDRWHGVMIQLFLVAQGVLAVAGMAVLFSRGVSRWLKQSPVHVEPASPEANTANSS